MAGYRVLYSPESLEEIKDVIDFYNKKSKGLGSRFKNNLLAEIKLIKTRPLSRSFRYDNVRFAVVDKFPYSAHYTVDEEEKLIKIQAVLAFAQNDKANWKLRF